MKRVLSVIIVIFIMTCFTGYADSDKEIRFRNISWGINIDEVKQALSDIELWNDGDGYPLSHWSDKQAYYIVREENGWMGWCFNNYTGEPLKVAGYPVSIVYVYCAYSLDETGNVLRNRESSEFYMASYIFDVLDKQGTYEDLKAKMTSLYGEGKETIEYGSGIYNTGSDEWKSYKSTTMRVEWRGANNTGVVLTGIWDDREMGVSIESGVTLVYGKTDYDDKLIRIEKAVAQEKLQIERDNRTNDTDGL